MVHGKSRTPRTRTWALLGAAAVAAVAAGVVVPHHGAAHHRAPAGAASTPAAVPSTLEALPQGPPPRLAYSTGRVVHLGGRDVRLGFVPYRLLRVQNGIVVASDDGRLMRIDSATGTTTWTIRTPLEDVTASPDGSEIAWARTRKGRAVVVLAKVGPGGTITARFEQGFPARPRCCDDPFTLDGITSSGLLVASESARERTWVWDLDDGSGSPAHEVRRVRELGQLVVQGSGNAVVVDDDGGVSLAPRDGRGTSQKLGVPALGSGSDGTWPDTVLWEDASHVLITYLSDVGRAVPVIRCSTRSLRCERATEFPSSSYTFAR